MGARRVLAGDVAYGRRAAWLRFDRAASAILVLIYLASVGALLRLFR